MNPQDLSHKALPSGETRMYAREPTAQEGQRAENFKDEPCGGGQRVMTWALAADAIASSRRESMGSRKEQEAEERARSARGEGSR
jgi:hypothetical protein